MDTCVVCAIFADSGPFQVTSCHPKLADSAHFTRQGHAGVHVYAPVERISMCLTTLQEL